ncbi:MAG: SxtJ family membrane protein [Gammaproteobacteria bacterium]
MKKLLNQIQCLDRRGLRRFGITTGLIVAVIFGIFFPWLLETQSPFWVWVFSVFLILWSIISPGTLKPFYHLWMTVALLLNKITTPILLGIIFYLIFVPAGYAMQIFRRNPVARKIDRSITTYRVPSDHYTRESMERPF